jgi:hypothetical protein
MDREFLKAMHERRDRGFTEQEMAFYDALADNACGGAAAGAFGAAASVRSDRLQPVESSRTS